MSLVQHLKEILLSLLVVNKYAELWLNNKQADPNTYLSNTYHMMAPCFHFSLNPYYHESSISDVSDDKNESWGSEIISPQGQVGSKR